MTKIRNAITSISPAIIKCLQILCVSFYIVFLWIQEYYKLGANSVFAVVFALSCLAAVCFSWHLLKLMKLEQAKRRNGRMLIILGWLFVVVLLIGPAACYIMYKSY